MNRYRVYSVGPRFQLLVGNEWDRGCLVQDVLLVDRERGKVQHLVAEACETYVGGFYALRGSQLLFAYTNMDTAERVLTLVDTETLKTGRTVERLEKRPFWEADREESALLDSLRQLLGPDTSIEKISIY